MLKIIYFLTKRKIIACLNIELVPVCGRQMVNIKLVKKSSCKCTEKEIEIEYLFLKFRPAFAITSRHAITNQLTVLYIISWFLLECSA